MFRHLQVFAHHRASRATATQFAGMGLMFGAWAALIPYVKLKFELDEAQLGLLLLCFQAGVLVMNPFSVPLLHRFGAAQLSAWSLAFGAAMFCFPIGSAAIWGVGLGLFAAGVSLSATNVAMNTCASLLEERGGLRLMSACHGFWSGGAMLGAALASTSTGLGLLPIWLMLGLAGIVAVASVWAFPELKNVPGEHAAEAENAAKPSGFLWPTAALWGLIIISLAVNLTEGTMNDWSAVYLRDTVRAPEILTGWGFSVYAFCMAVGRFAGDGLIDRLGQRRALQLGGAVAAAGLLAVIVFPETWVVLAGCGAVGAGVSLGAPILYAAAARVPGLAAGAGLATMNTFAMLGFLGGPAVIGFLAKTVTLRWAFLAVVGMMGLWIWRARRV